MKDIILQRSLQEENDRTSQKCLDQGTAIPEAEKTSDPGDGRLQKVQNSSLAWIPTGRPHLNAAEAGTAKEPMIWWNSLLLALWILLNNELISTL